ncbi:MAG: lytic transglycosylase domain-containing protein [candidate division KSB1 bacterium]|nr:lytic transglycosylase domain-containing protein [candidate division KSB1 bacterium]
MRAMKIRYYLIWVLFILLSGNVSAVESPVNERLFPIPDEIKANVEFWINIYSSYGINTIIIHDDKRLDIIYEVIDLDTLFNDEKISQKDRKRAINKLENRYRKILKRLAKRRCFEVPLLGAEELRVYRLFGCANDGDLYADAVSRVRSQYGFREAFEEGIKRSGRYIGRMKAIFDAYLLPPELIALPHVESSFNIKAYSKYGAAGMWQFIRSTGKQFLTINYKVDERLDPEKSTVAAAKLLRRNYRELRSWPLALTAYNHGLRGMKRAVKKMGTRDIGAIVAGYESKSFKFASRNFYAEFIAALIVSNNVETYFADLQLDRPEEYRVIKLPDHMKTVVLLEEYDLDIDEMKRLNPAVRSTAISANRSLPRGYQIRLPAEDVSKDEKTSVTAY